MRGREQEIWGSGWAQELDVTFWENCPSELTSPHSLKHLDTEGEQREA